MNQRVVDKQRVKQKYAAKVQAETEKMNRELDMKLKAQRDRMQVLCYLQITHLVDHLQNLRISVLI